MKPSCIPSGLEQILAKSAARGADQLPETLPEHTWHVLARLSDLANLRPGLPQTLGVPRLWHILFWAAFLHDFGKATSGFQVMLRGGARWTHRHEVLSLAFLDWILPGLASGEDAWVAAAIVSHHKDAAEIERDYADPDEPEDDQLIARVAELDAATLEHLWDWIADCSATWIRDLGFERLGVEPVVLVPKEQAVAAVQRNGVRRIRFWLRAYRRFIQEIDRRRDRTLVVQALTLRGTIINADHSASAHAGMLPQPNFDRTTILGEKKLELHDHQKQAGATGGSALLIAPTGSGKTEAALLWTAQQATTGSLPRMFYTLPYQASMNAMKLRLEASFGKENVGLQHGRGLLALYRLLLERDYTPETAARQARWMRDLTRLNYPPVRVFSPFQMLKGMYRLKGYEALLSDYHGAAFIFDEIHAYEVQRLAMILKTVEYLSQQFGARFLVMSATFPSLIRERLDYALGHPAQILAAPDLYEKFRRHHLHVLNGDLLSEEGLDRIVRDAEAGKSVLVVCNLVSRAQEAYRVLSARLVASGVPVELLHGRFTMRDRSAKEQLVREATGSHSTQRRSIVLVATQVVEVSLDIDLDTIYSDPAPLEALVQRFGRINRRGKQSQPAPVYVYRQPDDGQRIYDRALVEHTLAILSREHDRPVDESAVGNWLDEIYSGTVADRWRREYDQAAADFEATCIRGMRPFESSQDLEQRFYEAFDSIEVLPAGLAAEYQALRDDEPIRAGELLVSIRWQRYRMLQRAGLVAPSNPPVVQVGYDAQMGLTYEE